MIGFFVNMLVVRSEASQGSFRQLLERLRARVLAIHAHQDVPFEHLVDALAPERHLGHMPLFQVVLGLHTAVGDEVVMPGLEVEPRAFSSGTSKFDLTLLMDEFTSAAGVHRLDGTLEYDRDLFDATTTDRMLRHFRALLEAVATDPAARPDALGLLASAERHQLTVEWNDTAREVATHDALMHELFERRADERPEATAVVFAEHHLSYTGLEAASNELAHALIDSEVAPGDAVGVLLERSAEMVVAVLGILKAGAAYVPLETRNPDARMRTILESMAIPAVVSQQAWSTRIDGWLEDLPSLHTGLCLDVSDEPAVRDSAGGVQNAGAPFGLGCTPSSNPARQARPRRRGTVDHLAYVIFTSGSTGTPKGVMERHRAVVNLLDWVNRTYSVGPGDRVLFVTSLGFDLSVYDVFGVLAAGGCVRVASSEEVGDPMALARILATEPITFWDSAPAALQQVAAFLPAAVGDHGRGPLRLVFLSGDWVPLGLPGEVA